MSALAGRSVELPFAAAAYCITEPGCAARPAPNEAADMVAEMAEMAHSIAALNAGSPHG